MGMLTPMNVIEGKLAADGRYFPPRDGRPAFASFRVLRTRAWRNDRGEWTEAREPTPYNVEFRGPNAERVRPVIDDGLLVRGSSVIAGGTMSDRPRAWIDESGAVHAENVIEGIFITEDTIPAARRYAAQQSGELPQ